MESLGRRQGERADSAGSTESTLERRPGQAAVTEAATEIGRTWAWTFLCNVLYRNVLLPYIP